jgi:hypothetical protein
VAASFTPEYAAPAEEHSGSLASWRHRLSPWRMLVGVSALALGAAAAGMLALWIATSGERTTSYAFAGPLFGVDITVGEGDVRILGGGRSDVHVLHTDRFAYGHEPGEQVDLEEGVLKINSGCPSLVVGTCSADYELSVPDNVAVTVRVTNGNVRVGEFRGSAELTVEGGSIAVGGFCGFSLQATASRGDVDVRTSCAVDQLAVRSDTGDVTALVPPGTYQIDADSNGGRVAVDGVRASEDAPWTIQALSGSGNVTVGARP